MPKRCSEAATATRVLMYSRHVSVLFVGTYRLYAYFVWYSRSTPGIFEVGHFLSATMFWTGAMSIPAPCSWNS